MRMGEAENGCEMMVWSNQWLRERSWRTIQRYVRQFRNFDPLIDDSIYQSRRKRTFEEWARRKREGGGGLAAKKGA